MRGLSAIVVGAGPGGLAAALALRRKGINVTVIERASSSGDVGSALTLWPNATRALGTLGVSRFVRDLARPLERIVMRNQNNQVLFEEPLAPFDGGGRWISAAIRRVDLVAVLWKHVADCIITGRAVDGVQQTATHVEARLAGGDSLAGDLLIGADGLHSVVRRELIGDSLRPAGFSVWRGIGPMSLPEAAGTTWMGRGLQFGAFPMLEDRTYWFAAATRTPSSRPSEAPLERFSSWPLPVSQLIASTQPGTIACTDVFDRRPLRRWTFGRMTLLGDAAHPAVPTLGQGACQAIEDAVVLADSIQGHDIPQELCAYEAQRLRRANGLVEEARRIGQAGTWKHPVACWLRDRMIASAPASSRRRQLSRMFAFSTRGGDAEQ